MEEEPIAISIETSDETKKEILSYDRTIKYLIVSGVIITSVFLILFLYKRSYFLFNDTIDNSLLGTFGDFIGGVFGTFLTFYSMIMIIRTFQNQIKSNDQTQTTNEKLLEATIKSNQLVHAQNEQQSFHLFDSQFNSFFNLYADAINDYASEECSGKENLDKLVEKFLGTEFENKATYGKRVSTTLKLYEEFYTENHGKMSVHFRMLYQLFQFISDAQISDYVKVYYAKAVRGNMSEAEMILLRYNCHCLFGKKMQLYVNEFNLLKHIPIMKLLEFRKWSQGLDNDCITALNTMFVTLRKNICTVLLDKSTSVREESVSYGKQWSIVLLYRKTDNILYVKIQKNSNISRKGTIISHIEKAFDSLGIDNLNGMFYDYFMELFFISNFNIYNRKESVKISHRVKQRNNIDKIIYMFKSQYPLILSQRQIASPQRI